MTRIYTNKILKLLDEDLFDKNVLIRDLLNWMSEDDVEEFYNKYDFKEFSELNEDEDEDLGD